MPYDERLVERVQRILSGRPDVVKKKMIGGLSFMVNGRLCCGVTAGFLVVRIRPEARHLALSQPHVRPMKFAGKTLAGFVCVEPEGCRRKAALATWVQQGIDCALTQPTKTPATARRGPKAPRKS